MNFEIGEIPKGWKRGDALRVIQVSKDRPQDRGALMHVGSPFVPWESVPEIGAVTFTFEMAEKVDAWLKWWREPVAAIDSSAEGK